MFAISIWQWIIEVSYACVIIIFYCFFYKMSRFVDLLVNLLNVFVTFILQPGFYLAGDSHFRGLIASKGVIRAIAVTLTDGIIRRKLLSDHLEHKINFLVFHSRSIKEDSFWRMILKL